MSITGIPYGKAKVSPQDLLAKAERAQQLIEEYSEQLSQMTRLMDQSEAQWIGKAGDTYREVFHREAKIIEVSIDELKKYPQELLQYHGLYSDTIDKTESTVDSIVSIEMA